MESNLGVLDFTIFFGFIAAVIAVGLAMVSLGGTTMYFALRNPGRRSGDDEAERSLEDQRPAMAG